MGKSIFHFIIFLFFASSLSCINNSKSDCDVLSFDEGDYKLIHTSKDDLGNKYSEEYMSKSNEHLLLRKIFWENGSVQAVSFFESGQRVGPMKYYDKDSTLLYSGFYYKDKETGITIEYSEKEKKAVIKTYQKGQILNQQEIK